MKVMIAGIGGASLGTEIAKSLQMANGYKIYGCDISTEAYGLYQPEFKKTYLVDRDDYISDVEDVNDFNYTSFISKHYKNIISS
mgnify:CR=1 FL=1